MESRKIIKIRECFGCSNEVQLIMVDDQPYIWKSKAGHIEKRDGIILGRVECEYIAYLVDQALGLGVVPETRIDIINGEMGILQKFADGVDNVGWQNSYGTEQAVFTSHNPTIVLKFKSPYYLLDGIEGGGPGSWKDGFGIKVTATGTENHAKLFWISNNEGDDVHHITIRHVDICHRGVHYPLTGDDCIYEVFSNIPFGTLGNSHDITFSYCYIHNSCRTLLLTGRGYNWIIEYSYLSVHLSY